MMETNKKNIGRTNKRKGSDAERFYAKIFREELGFTHCKTSRFGSKLHDDAGIDLIFLPFNVQIKAGKQVGLNVSREITNMKVKTKEYFPEDAQEQDFPKIVIHKKETTTGRKRLDTDEIVSMTFEDFKKFIKKIEKWK